MIYDELSLNEEVAAAGLSMVVRHAHADGTVEWVDPPTTTQLAQVRDILAAHDPGKRERERDAERAEIRDIVLRLMQDTRADVWGQLAPATRQETTRLGLRLAAMIARRM
jgi:hypothetical protein